jgi:hypothetical protein
MRGVRVSERTRAKPGWDAEGGMMMMLMIIIIMLMTVAVSGGGQHDKWARRRKLRRLACQTRRRRWGFRGSCSLPSAPAALLDESRSPDAQGNNAKKWLPVWGARGGGKRAVRRMMMFVIMVMLIFIILPLISMLISPESDR